MSDDSKPDEIADYVFEVAVTPEGTISLNIKDLPVDPNGWGHLTFTVEQGINFVIALQAAVGQAYRNRVTSKAEMN